VKPNDITHTIIGAAIDVHRAIGPGQDEVLYEDALEVALRGRGIRFQRQRPLPVFYRGVKLDCGFRPDFVAEKTVVAECKAVELMHPVFEAQVRTYQRLGGWPLGLLLNFNVPVMKEGVARYIVNENEFRQEEERSARIRRTQRAGNLTETIIGAAIEVHRRLGPGLLHSVYSACLRHELTLAELTFETGRRQEVTFQGAKLDHAGELDLIVAGQVLVAARSVPELLPLHEAQVRSQMHLADLPSALLVNFHAQRLIDDLKRFGCLESSVSSKTLC
jgi:GxxExxY protein